MSRKERNRIIIDLLKSLLMALLTAFFGIFAYLVINPLYI